MFGRNKDDNMEEFFKGKTVLITGHTGFKGSWLSEILINWESDVFGFSLYQKLYGGISRCALLWRR